MKSGRILLPTAVAAGGAAILLWNSAVLRAKENARPQQAPVSLPARTSQKPSPAEGAMSALIRDLPSLDDAAFAKRRSALALPYDTMTVADFEATLLAIPGEADCLGLFYDVIGNFLELHFDAARAFLDKAAENHAYPQGWISSSMANGIGRLAQKDRVGAIRAALAQTIQATPAGRSDFLGETLLNLKPEHAHETMNALITLPDRETLAAMGYSSRFWEEAFRTGTAEGALLKIRDSDRYNTSLKGFGKGVANSMPAEQGLAMISRLVNNRAEALEGYCDAWFAKDPNVAMATLQQCDPRARTELISNHAGEIAKVDPEAAERWAASITDDDLSQKIARRKIAEALGK